MNTTNTQIIPYGRQHITDEDIAAVIKTLRSDHLTQGPAIKQFEEDFASYIGCRYAVAVSNGTAALHIAAMALGVNEESNIITTPITFAASANCIEYCRGNVWFADIDPHTYTIDFTKVEDLVRSKPEGFFKGIIPVDFAGHAVDLEKLRTLADKYGLWILEDACHAPGAYFIDNCNEKQYSGNGKFADLSVFSFHPVKHIATGEGGMITTNNDALYQKLLLYRTHGITRNQSSFVNSKSFAIGDESSEISEWPGWYMEMQELGYNYRLTDFQAALGISQLKRADNGLNKRRAIAKKYSESFSGHSWLKGQSGYVDGHAYHLYVIEVQNRLGLYNYLKTKNIYTQVHYIPTHLMPYYRDLGWKEGDMPVAEKYYTQCLSLPMYPTLSIEEQEYVINQIKTFFEY
jgi:UDP-4-amino-4,6-dideoxy-N-acetyl-beta-L-altrosamine transaminase